MRLITKFLLILCLSSSFGGYLKWQAKAAPSNPCLMFYKSNYPVYQVNFYTGRFTAFEEGNGGSWGQHFWTNRIFPINEHSSLELIWEKPWENTIVDLYLRDNRTDQVKLIRKAVSDTVPDIYSGNFGIAPNQQYSVIVFTKNGRPSVFIFNAEAQLVDEIYGMGYFDTWSEDSRYLFLQKYIDENRKQVIRWDSHDHSLLFTYKETLPTLTSPVISSDKQTILTYGYNSDQTQVEIYKISYTNHTLQHYRFPIGGSGRINGVSWSSNNHDVIFSTYDGVYIITDELIKLKESLGAYPFKDVYWLENGSQVFYWDYDLGTKTHQRVLYDVPSHQHLVQETGLYTIENIWGYFWQVGSKTFWVDDLIKVTPAISWDWQIDKILQIQRDYEDRKLVGYVMLWQKDDLQYSTYFDLATHKTFTYQHSFVIGEFYDPLYGTSYTFDNPFWYWGTSGKFKVGGLYDAYTGKNIIYHGGLSKFSGSYVGELSIVHHTDYLGVTQVDIYDRNGMFLYALPDAEIYSSYAFGNLATYIPNGATSRVIARLTPQKAIPLVKNIVKVWKVFQVSQTKWRLVMYENQSYEQITMVLDQNDKILGRFTMMRYLNFDNFYDRFSPYLIIPTNCSIRPEWQDHVIARGGARVDARVD